MSPVDRIPVVLLTGALGSGKTTLLAAWLRQPALRDAALVINEVGEVGLDDRLLRPLAQAAEGAALLANTCVCCSGLPGLEEALADLYRARLERRIARFDTVVIETTGLAEPQPIRAAFEGDALLRERYVLAGVIATVSGTAPALLEAAGAARAQVAGADLLVVTKCDRAGTAAVQALEGVLRTLNPCAAIALSAQADLAATHALRLLPAPRTHAVPHAAAPPSQVDHAAPAHGPAHHRHAAEAVFVPLPQPWPRAALALTLQRCIASGAGELLRIKGVVRADDGLALTVQWAPGDEVPMLAPFTGDAPAPGLTVIAAGHAAASRAAASIRLPRPSS